MDIDELKSTFVRLTEEALPEKDGDTFIKILLQREPYGMDLINHRVRIDEREAHEMLAREIEVLERLQEERTKLLKQMDQLSRSRRGARSYASKFPFPSMPVFCDRSE